MWTHSPSDHRHRRVRATNMCHWTVISHQLLQPALGTSTVLILQCASSLSWASWRGSNVLIFQRTKDKSSTQELSFYKTDDWYLYLILKLHTSWQENNTCSQPQTSAVIMGMHNSIIVGILLLLIQLKYANPTNVLGTQYTTHVTEILCI